MYVMVFQKNIIPIVGLKELDIIFTLTEYTAVKKSVVYHLD